MSNSDNRVYVHFVWTTKFRQPMLSSEIERSVHRIIVAEAEKLNCVIVAVNGTENHAHVLVRVAPQIPVGRLVNQFKGVSSRCVNADIGDKGEAAFEWQRGYGAYSVASKQVSVVANYIYNQKERHAKNATWPSLEPTLEKT